MTPVTISLAGHRFTIRPVPISLDRLLTRHLKGSQRCNGCAVESTVESLLFRDRPFTNAGLLEVISSLLRCAGIDFETVCDEPLIPPLDLPRTVDAGLRAPIDRAFIRIVSLRHRGLIRYGGGCKPARFIEQFARMCPDATLVIATSRAAGRDRIAAQLRKRGIELSKAYTSRPPARNSRIVVSTWYGLAHSEVETWRRTSLIVPNALDALHARAQDALLQAGARFRLFGFLPMGQTLAPRERDLLACVFGLEELVVPEHGRLPRPVSVIWHRFRHRPVEVVAASTFDRKRVQFWSNPARNRLIRRIARFFCRETRDVQEPEPSRLEARPVTVLTENLEHAIELGEVLPDLPIAVGPESDVTGLSTRQRRILDRATRRDSPNRHVIATTGGLSVARLAGTEILIWAGAGIAPPVLPVGGILG